MGYCPHCHEYYDDDNDTQPLCPGCGHPYICSCFVGDDSGSRYSTTIPRFRARPRELPLVSASAGEDEAAAAVKQWVPLLMHLVNIENVASILRHGLLSYNAVRRMGLKYEDVSMSEVQERRARTRLAGRSLHEYASLYFWPRNAMLFKLREIQDQLVVLVVNPDVLSRGEAYFTDGNAAADGTTAYFGAPLLAHLPWNIIKAERWNTYPDGKRIACAEVLVYPCVPPDDIAGIACRTSAQRAILQATCPELGLEIVEAPQLYY
jgi:hypothetical protein